MKLFTVTVTVTAAALLLAVGCSPGTDSQNFDVQKKGNPMERQEEVDRSSIIMGQDATDGDPGTNDSVNPEPRAEE